MGPLVLVIEIRDVLLLDATLLDIWFRCMIWLLSAAHIALVICRSDSVLLRRQSVRFK